MQRLVDNIDKALSTEGTNLVMHVSKANGVYNKDSLQEKWYEIMSEGIK